MRTLALVMILALALAAGAARADGLLYVGAGVSSNQIDNLDYTSDKLDQTSWKLLFGVRPLSVVGFEGDYFDMGHVDTLSSNGNTHNDVSAFAAYGVGYLPLPVPYLDVFGKVGLASWDVHSSTSGPFGYYSYSTHGSDFAWGVGAQVHSGHLGARLEYEGFNVASSNGARIVSLSMIFRWL